jgi:hypothetical protein
MAAIIAVLRYANEGATPDAAAFNAIQKDLHFLG